MSGCVNCVYTLYADDLEEFTAAVGEARAALTKQGVAQAEWPSLVRPKDGESDEPLAPLVPDDPVMAAFLA